MGDDLKDPLAGNFVPVPQRVSISTPSSSKAYAGDNEYGDPVYRSVTVPSAMPGPSIEEQAEQAYLIEKDLLAADGECTFSHREDWDGDGPQWRQCKSGTSMMPPPPGALLDPVGIAVDGTTVYVVDDYNHRIQAFDFEGRVKPMKFPIGNGIPGDGIYTYSNYFPYAGFPGYQGFDGGYSGSQLNAPNGIAVDASRNLVVADAGNYRIAAFDGDGAALFSVPMPVHLGIQTKPTLVAMTPGATALPLGSAIPEGRENDRIVVTDWSHCFVHVYRVNFELVKSLPDALAPEGMGLHDPLDGCIAADATQAFPDGFLTGPGQFSTVTGATIDQSGNILITDHAQNAVQVLNTEGLTRGFFGRPGQQPTPGALAGPVGVAIDHLGRVGVIDAGNSRVVFYTVMYPGGAPSATFEFQLDTTVSVDDFPMGLVEQRGPAAEGLDPKGRFLATDPLGQRLLRFELPELVIVDAQAQVLADQPANLPPNTVAGRGTFKVAVPKQKDGDVVDVEVFVAPVESGVTVVPGSITPSNDPQTGGAPDIGPGEFVNYSFDYLADISIAQATFDIDARGDLQNGVYLAEAPQAQARARAACVGCDATHEVYWLDQNSTPGLASTITNPTTGSWYRAGVTARLSPIPDDGSVSHIGWYYEGAAAIFYPEDGNVQESELGEDGYISVPVGVVGVSRIYYWAITDQGAISATHFVDLNVDPISPNINFLLWPPYTGTVAQRWYNHPVSVGYTVWDAHSGTNADTQANPAAPDGQLLFTSEGRDQSQNLVLTDRVNNSVTVNSATATGGRLVNIDMTAPTFGPDALQFTVVANGFDGASYADLPAGTLTIQANDPRLNDGLFSLGSRPSPWNVGNLTGVKVRDGGTVTFQATDFAGNTSTTTAVIRVTPRDKLPATATVVGGVFTYDGTSRPGTCTVTGDGQTFPGTLTYSPINVAPIAAGVVTATCSFAGNDNLLPATSVSTLITINPRPITITAQPKTKLPGALDPALTYTITAGSLVSGDSLTGTLERTAGELLNIVYPITQGTLTAGPNYSITFVPANLTIVALNRPPTVSAPNRTDLRGASVTGQVTGSDPDGDVLTYTATGLPPGASMTSTGAITGILTTSGVYSVSVTVKDPSNATGTGSFIWTVVTPNVPPTAANDSATSVGAAPVNITVLANDADANGGTLSVTGITQPTAGATVGVVTTSGNVVVFTPATGFVGTATFTYAISDGQGGSATATVTVTITAPAACTSTGYLTYSQGGWGNSGAPGQFMAAHFSQVYPGGFVTIGGTNTLKFTTAAAITAFLPQGGTPAVLTSSAVNPTSSSAGNFAAQLLSVRLAVDYSAAGKSKAGLGELVMASGPFAGSTLNNVLAVANEVIGGNTSALPGGMSISTLNGILESINMNYHEGTVNNGLLICPTGQCVVGTINLNDPSGATSGTAGNLRTFAGAGVSVKASAFSRTKSSGSWSTAFLGAFGTAGLGVTDGSEGSGSNDSHKVDNLGDRQNYVLFEFSQPVVVTRAFLASVGDDSDITVWVGTKVNPFSNHLTLSDSLLSSLGAPQTNATTSAEDRWATFNSGNVTANVIVIAADVADTTPEDSFKVAKLDLTCGGVANQPPTVTASNQSNDEGVAVSVQIAAADPNSDALTYSATGLPPGLSINATTGLITGTLGYTASGTYNVTITVADQAGLTKSATFAWTVANRNRPPTVSGAARTDNKGVSVNFTVTGSDPDGDVLTYTATGLPPGASMTTAGVISGTLTTAGTYTVTLTAKDPSNTTGSGTFVWTVIVAANRAPTVTISDRTDNKGTAMNLQITGSDLDGDTLTYTATGLPPGVTMSSTGKITGTLATAGVYNVTVTVKDPSNLTGSTTFCWTVKTVNIAPDAKNDALSTTKNTSKTISVIGNDTDANGHSLSITSVSTPSKGSVVKYSNGTIKYTPPKNWVGTTSFTYTISDGNGGSDTATVSVTVSSHSNNDDCDDDHDHNGSRGDRDDRRERDCNRNHSHNNDCDRR